MPDNKRNRGDQPQGENQGQDRQRSRDRKPGSGGIESPEQPATRRDQEEESQE